MFSFILLKPRGLLTSIDAPTVTRFLRINVFMDSCIKCTYGCGNEAVTYMDLIGSVCKTCLRTKVWAYYNYTEQDIEDYLAEKGETVYE